MIESQFQISTNFNGQIRVEKRRRIPEGTYFCKIVDWKTMFMFGGHKLIIDCYFSEYEINISFICNIQISPDGTVKNPGRRSRLFKLLKALSGRSQGNFNLDDLIVPWMYDWSYYEHEGRTKNGQTRRRAILTLSANFHLSQLIRMRLMKRTIYRSSQLYLPTWQKLLMASCHDRFVWRTR